MVQKNLQRLCKSLLYAGTATSENQIFQDIIEF